MNYIMFELNDFNFNKELIQRLYIEDDGISFQIQMAEECKTAWNVKGNFSKTIIEVYDHVYHLNDEYVMKCGELPLVECVCSYCGRTSRFYFTQHAYTEFESWLRNVILLYLSPNDEIPELLKVGNASYHIEKEYVFNAMKDCVSEYIISKDYLPIDNLEDKLSNTVMYQCAQAYYDKSGRYYTFLIDDVSNSKHWMVIETGDFVHFVTFMKLPEWMLPVPKEQMKHIIPCIKKSIYHTLNVPIDALITEDSYEDEVSFILENTEDYIKVNHAFEYVWILAMLVAEKKITLDMVMEFLEDGEPLEVQDSSFYYEIRLDNDKNVVYFIETTDFPLGKILADYISSLILKYKDSYELDDIIIELLFKKNFFSFDSFSK